MQRTIAQITSDILSAVGDNFEKYILNNKNNLNFLISSSCQDIQDNIDFYKSSHYQLLQTLNQQDFNLTEEITTYIEQEKTKIQSEIQNTINLSNTRKTQLEEIVEINYQLVKDEGEKLLLDFGTSNDFETSYDLAFSPSS